MQSKGWGLSRARERAVVAPFYVFSHLRKARSYRAPHFCTYVYYIYMHTRRACIYFLFRRWQERSRNLFALLKNSIKCHAHTHHPLPPTHLPHRPLIFIYTGCERGKSSFCAERRRARDTHTSQVNAALFCADTHHPRFVVFGENGMARSTNSLDAIFFTELAWRGLDKHNKAESTP